MSGGGDRGALLCYFGTCRLNRMLKKDAFDVGLEEGRASATVYFRARFEIVDKHESGGDSVAAECQAAPPS